MTQTLEEFLEHEGVKGMRWGVRKDGKVTARTAARTTNASDDAINARSAKVKSKTQGVHSLSNQELKVLIERQNLEQQYSRLNPDAVANGKKIVMNILQKQGEKLATKAVETAAQKAVEAAIAAAAKRTAAKAAVSLIK